MYRNCVFFCIEVLFVNIHAGIKFVNIYEVSVETGNSSIISIITLVFLPSNII